MIRNINKPTPAKMAILAACIVAVSGVLDGYNIDSHWFMYLQMGLKICAVIIGVFTAQKS